MHTHPLSCLHCHTNANACRTASMCTIPNVLSVEQTHILFHSSAILFGQMWQCPTPLNGQCWAFLRSTMRFGSGLYPFTHNMTQMPHFRMPQQRAKKRGAAHIFVWKSTHSHRCAIAVRLFGIFAGCAMHLRASASEHKSFEIEWGVRCDLHMSKYAFSDDWLL